MHCDALASLPAEQVCVQWKAFLVVCGLAQCVLLCDIPEWAVGASTKRGCRSHSTMRLFRSAESQCHTCSDCSCDCQPAEWQQSSEGFLLSAVSWLSAAEATQAAHGSFHFVVCRHCLQLAAMGTVHTVYQPHEAVHSCTCSIAVRCPSHAARITFRICMSH